MYLLTFAGLIIQEIRYLRFTHFHMLLRAYTQFYIIVHAFIIYGNSLARDLTRHYIECGRFVPLQLINRGRDCGHFNLPNGYLHH